MSPFADLRTGCTVTEQLAEDPPAVTYTDSQNTVRSITGQWLVGADGKVGIVRKHFLEPTAGIRQEVGKYSYDGTWIAANLKISLPTPQTHPQFPLWALGYTPESVYDLFWPDGWHFCSPPGKPTAAGRFGPHEERLWRHEFRQDTTADDLESESALWEHIMPMITLQGDAQNACDFREPVQYPHDCITVLRCRPFRFTHKVVNRWFHKKTILIGDAAHVFPPFAGQGIASGLRDAHQLAWRLSLLVQSDSLNPRNLPCAEHLLGSWSRERRSSVDDAAFFSTIIGQLCNDQPTVWMRFLLAVKTNLDRFPWLSHMLDPMVQKERQGFAGVPDGFFAKEYNGGVRMAQIILRSSSTKKLVLSDFILSNSPTAFTIVAITDGNDTALKYNQLRKAISDAALPETALTKDSIVFYRPTATIKEDHCLDDTECIEIYSPCDLDPASPEYARCGGYDAQAYIDRLGRSTQFAIIRADLFIFACVKDYTQLCHCLSLLKQQLR